MYPPRPVHSWQTWNQRYKCHSRERWMMKQQNRGEMTQTFAANLRRILNEREMTYRDLSKASGMSLKSVYNLCEGSNSPSLSTIEKITTSMHISPHALITPDASLDLMLSRRSERAQKALNNMSSDRQREAVSILENMIDDKRLSPRPSYRRNLRPARNLIS